APVKILPVLEVLDDPRLVLLAGRAIGMRQSHADEELARRTDGGRSRIAGALSGANQHRRADEDAEGDEPGERPNHKFSPSVVHSRLLYQRFSHRTLPRARSSSRCRNSASRSAATEKAISAASPYRSARSVPPTRARRARASPARSSG